VKKLVFNCHSYARVYPEYSGSYMALQCQTITYLFKLYIKRVRVSPNSTAVTADTNRGDSSYTQPLGKILVPVYYPNYNIYALYAPASISTVQCTRTIFCLPCSRYLPIRYVYLVLSTHDTLHLPSFFLSISNIRTFKQSQVPSFLSFFPTLLQLTRSRIHERTISLKSWKF
jgi:hypothetical protein